MFIEVIEVTSFLQNCRILYKEKGGECIVVDPGGEADKIMSYLEAKKLTVSNILLTHSHIDHCGGVKHIKEKTGANLFAHPKEEFFRENVVQIAQEFGIFGEAIDNCPSPDSPLLGGEELNLLGYNFQVIFTPGHSPGHLAFYCKELKIILSGDLLFAGSIGRYDLPFSNYNDLMESINKVIMLGDDIQVLPGHGPETSIGIEKKHNPFLMGGSL